MGQHELVHLSRMLEQIAANFCWESASWIDRARYARPNPGRTVFSSIHRKRHECSSMVPGSLESGPGREGARVGLEEYLETKLGGFSI